MDDVFLLDVELPKIVLPFEMSWSEAKKSVTLIYWFKVLHGAIIPEREHFMARMLRDRYRMANAPASCEIDCGEEHLMSDAEREKFRRYAEPIVEKFEGMGFDVMSLTDENAVDGKVDQEVWEGYQGELFALLVSLTTGEAKYLFKTHLDGGGVSDGFRGCLF